MRISIRWPAHPGGILALALSIIMLVATGPAPAQGSQAPPAPPPPREYVPYDPAKEPAFRMEEELRKGAEGLRTGQSPFPEIAKQVGPGLFELGTIRLDLNARRLTVPGRINMTQGIIEYLAVMDRRGKLHESVLALDAQPSLLQLALILLGLEQSEWAPPHPVTRRFVGFTKPGDPLLLWVEWDRANKTERVPANLLVYNRETGRPLEGQNWHFTGSFFSRNRFAADVTGSVVATWLDLRAIINTPAQAENPYRGPNLGYEVNSKLVPPVDTPIRLVIEPIERDRKKASPGSPPDNGDQSGSPR